MGAVVAKHTDMIVGLDMHMIQPPPPAPPPVDPAQAPRANYDAELFARWTRCLWIGYGYLNFRFPKMTIDEIRAWLRALPANPAPSRLSPPRRPGPGEHHVWIWESPASSKGGRSGMAQVEPLDCYYFGEDPTLTSLREESGP